MCECVRTLNGLGAQNDLLTFIAVFYLFSDLGSLVDYLHGDGVRYEWFTHLRWHYRGI